MDIAFDFLSAPPDASLLYAGFYSPAWVGISVLLAILGSYAAQRASKRIGQLHDTASKLTWASISALTMGVGIWAMHFVGMLALNLPCRVTYDPLITLISMIPGILAAGFALGVVWHGTKHLSLIFSSVLLGAGIGTMHYTGMAAMRLEGFVRYDPTLFALSIFVAIALSYVALRIKNGSARLGKGHDVVVAVAMGTAVSGMHYSAMAAANFVQGDVAALPPAVLTTDTLAIVIAVTTAFLALGALTLAAISHNREVANQLRDSEERWKFALEGSGEGVWDWNPQTDAAMYTKQLKAMIGYAEDEFPDTGAAFVEHIHHDDEARVLAAVQDCLSGNQRFYLAEFRTYCKDGSWKWILSRGKVVARDGDGNALRMIGTTTDITERKRSEEQLRIAATAFESQEGMMVTDPAGVILRVNRAFTEITGYTAEEAVGQMPRLLKSGRHNADFYRAMWDSIRRTGSWQGEIWDRRKNGEEYPKWLTISAVKNSDGVVTHYIGMHYDITDRYEADASARRALVAEAATQAKSAFIANISHEIRTPLTPIIGFAESILQDNPDPETRDTLLNAIIRNGRHLFNLINEILDLSKIEADRLDIEKIDVDLSQLYLDIDSVIGTLARDKGLEFRRGFINPVPRRIHSDPTRIKQILMNLLSNAIKFTERGHVSLDCEFEPERKLLHFTVGDTGIGIQEGKLERLFKAFSQVDYSITRRYGGTGLGLYISQRLAKLLGGGITVTSQEGGGSQFTVSIAVEGLDMNDLISSPDISASSISYATGLPTTIPQLSGHVLLAEDSPDNQLLISHYIRKTGAQVSTAKNGQIALEMAMAHDYDMVLMDMQMPVMGGEETVELLRASGCQTPIVALTANAMKGDRENYTRIGCNDFLGKPIRQHVFYQMLANYMPKKSGELPGHPAPSGLERDEEFLELQAGFVASLAGYVVQLRQALARDDHAEVMEQAHQLKGLGGSFGFPEVTRHAGELETAMKAGQHARGKALADSLCELMNKCALTHSLTD